MNEYIIEYLAATFLALWLDRKSPIASPLKLFVFAYFIYYGIGAPLYDLMYPQQNNQDNYTFIILGYVCGLIGLVGRKNKSSFPMIDFRGFGMQRAYILLAISLGVMFFFTAIWIHQVGVIPILAEDIEYSRTVRAEGTYYARQMMTVAVPIYFLVLAAVVHFKKSIVPMLITALVLILCISIQGYRSFFVSIIAISVMVVYRVRKESFNRLYVGVALGVIFIVSVLYGYKRYVSGNQLTKNLLNVYEYAAQNFFIRTTSLQKIVDYFPDIEPYQYGSFYLRGFGFLIPGKQTGPGMWLKKDVFNLDFAGDGFNPGIIGEFYLNFGMTGVVLGMVFYGWMIKAAYEMYAYGRTPGKVIYGACAYFYIIMAMAPGLATTIAVLIWYGALVFGYQLMIRLKVR